MNEVVKLMLLLWQVYKKHSMSEDEAKKLTKLYENDTEVKARITKITEALKSMQGKDLPEVPKNVTKKVVSQRAEARLVWFNWLIEGVGKS